MRVATRRNLESFCWREDYCSLLGVDQDAGWTFRNQPVGRRHQRSPNTLVPTHLTWLKAFRLYPRSRKLWERMTRSLVESHLCPRVLVERRSQS